MSGGDRTDEKDAVVHELDFLSGHVWQLWWPGRAQRAMRDAIREIESLRAENAELRRIAYQGDEEGGWD